MATATSLGGFLQAILNAVKGDVLKDGLPAINAFFTSIVNNPSQANILAQVAAVQVNLLAALPNLQMDVTKDLASIVQNEVNALLASTAAPAKPV